MENRLLIRVLAGCSRDHAPSVRAATCIVIASLILFSGCTASMRPPSGEQGANRTGNTADAWVGDAPPPSDWTGCRPVNPMLVKPVQRPARAEASARLERDPVVPLDGFETAQMIGVPDVSSGENLAVWLVSKEAEQLENQRQAVLERHEGSWSLTSEINLNQLRKLQASGELQKLRPFLVRGRAKIEFTGGFGVSACGNLLHVHYISLGFTASVVTRLPVVVFLDHAPVRVATSVTVAR